MATTYRQKENLPARNVQGVMAIITPRDSQIHRLNAPGAILWGRCAPPGATFEELVDALKEAFGDVDLEVLTRDVRAFVDDAVDKGLLEVLDRP